MGHPDAAPPASAHRDVTAQTPAQRQVAAHASTKTAEPVRDAAWPGCDTVSNQCMVARKNHSPNQIGSALDDELSLVFENPEPLPLSQLSTVLDAISRDYRRMTGGEISVRGVRSGSIWINLVDMAGQANALFDFAANIGALATAIIGGAVVLKNRRRKGASTVIAIAELAAKTGAEVKLTHISSGKETTFLHMNPTDADLIVHHHGGEVTRLDYTEQPPNPRLEAALERYALEAVARGPIEIEAPLDPGARMLLVELLQALRETPRGRQAIERVREKLRHAGHDGAVHLIDSKVEDG